MARKFLDEDLHQTVVAEAKRKFDVWPSAYASGWVVQTYKARGGRFAGDTKGSRTGLTKWFGESWVDLSRPIREDGEVVGYEPCGRKQSGDPADYPKCRPKREAMRMTPAEVRDAIKRKRTAEAKAAKGGRGAGGARAPVRVATYKQNPEPYSDVEALAELASGGYGAFDDYYEHWDVDDLDPEGLRYGRKVIWQVTPGRAVKIDPDYVVSMPENIFDPDKLAAVVDAVQSGEKPVFDVGYGTVRVIGERDVAESQEAFERGETLTQRPLDEDDLGKLLFTVRDGNHRVFGALIAGERHVWMHLSDNDVQDVREWQRDRRAFLARFGKWADAQDARMQMLAQLLVEGSE